ncbi:hypothetical protein H4R26_004735 [Coemansia thaxteri]|uniref:Arylesterase n=1 Tax=Coemansia thaxteri TaxID=2663907 RepID=A0A9W8EHA0_9FUNG|nr:hypothetical protein H4R26_004735 [Coemansia thaxteri]
MACGNRDARTRWLHPDMHYNPVSEQLDDHNNIRSLQVLELSSTTDKLVPFSQDFRVHGFDIYWDNLDPAELTLMFVNHQRSGGAISIFKHRVGAGHIQHVKTVRSHLLPSPNDVVATSRNTFYATNDIKHARGIMRKIEIYFGMPWGHVVYYGPEGVASKAFSGIPYANGIAKSPDGGLIYVAASSEPSVIAFKPTHDDGSLQPVSKTLFRGFVPDNISVDTLTGELLVSGFLNALELLRYNREVLYGTNARPAGAVRRLLPFADMRKGFAEESVLIHDGTLLPATTTAVIQRRNRVRRIVLGSVMADHVAVCEGLQ